MRAGHARIGRVDVGKGHRIHAGELQRIEEAHGQAQQHDQRDRRGGAHQREQADGDPDHHRIHDQHRR